jgi:hypothetical protein
MGKLVGSRGKVGVDVRLEDETDFKPSLVGKSDIEVHIAPRIDNGDLFRSAASDDIGVLGQAGFEKLLKNHLSFFQGIAALLHTTFLRPIGFFTKKTTDGL